MARKLLLPKDVVDFLSRRYTNQHKTWLLSESQWPMTVTLGIPTENVVASDASSIRQWVDAWTSWSGPAKVSWVTRQWARLGAQRLPATLELAGPVEVAVIVGQGRRWRNATQRYEAITHRWPQLAGNAVLGRHFNVLADYAEADFSRLFAMLDWLERNPASGLAPRQLPVIGLDTKWLEKRTGIITELLKSILNSDQSGDFYAVCGLRRPKPRVRMRILCPQLRALVGGLNDIEAPTNELAALSIKPQRVIIVENLETGLALPDIEGTIAFMRLGIVGLRREAERKAAELIPALFLDMFGDPATNPKGWPMRRVSDFVSRFEGGKNLQAGSEGGSSYRILKVSAATSGIYREAESKPTPDAYVPPQSHIVRRGDMLFSRANTEELVGATAIVFATNGKTLLPDKLWRLVWAEPVAPAYMHALFQSIHVRRALGMLSSGTSASMRNISQGKLFDLMLPIAPYVKQERFAECSASVQSILNQQSAAIAKAQAAFDALLAQTFS